MKNDWKNNLLYTKCICEYGIDYAQYYSWIKNDKKFNADQEW